MSNKDLLKLENEFRGQMKISKEKPNIGPIEKPTLLTNKVSNFLKVAKQDQVETSKVAGDSKVEMDIYITSIKQ